MSNKEQYLYKIKMKIQKRANIDFPAQEIWFRENDESFWCYKQENNSLKLVEGIVINGELHYDVSVHNIEGEEETSKLCDQKTNDGYECFAILL